MGWNTRYSKQTKSPVAFSKMNIYKIWILFCFFVALIISENTNSQHGIYTTYRLWYFKNILHSFLWFKWNIRPTLTKCILSTGIWHSAILAVGSFIENVKEYRKKCSSRKISFGLVRSANELKENFWLKWFLFYFLSSHIKPSCICVFKVPYTIFNFYDGCCRVVTQLKKFCSILNFLLYTME